MVNWPAIIACDGDDELTYIASAAEWNSHPDRGSMGYGVDCRMIDSSGCVYHMDNMEGGEVQLLVTGHSMPVKELIALVQRHAALNNTCCIEKIGFRRIKEGLAIIASLVQE